MVGGGYLLVIVKHVQDVFDEQECKDSMIIIGAFSEKPMAEYMRLGIADLLNHGDRAVIFSVEPELNRTGSDIMVIVSGSVN